MRVRIVEWEVQVAIKYRLGVNGGEVLELKFHMVDNLHYLDGP